MIPRLRIALATFVFSLALLTLGTVFLIETDANAIPGSPTKSYCASAADRPVVYITAIFDIKTPFPASITTTPLNNAFYNYLIEEYDYKNKANYPTNCGVFETLSQAEANRRQILASAQQANRQIIEVNWQPSAALAVATDDGTGVAIFGRGLLPPTHTICAVGHESTMYFSAVFDSEGARLNPKWNDAFNDFLRKNYSAEGEANCTMMNTSREANQLLKDRVAGVRAQNHKAVETGWRFNASVVITKPAPKPTPKVDDDPEPAPRPTPVPATQSIKDFAMQEQPAVLAYCEKDQMLKMAFDCYRVQRSVYNYRMEHGSTDSLTTLFTKEKVNMADAINNVTLGLWVNKRVLALSPDNNRLSNCVQQKVIVAFYDKPYISQLEGIYKASLAACK
jgi:hypothetical protein